MRRSLRRAGGVVAAVLLSATGLTVSGAVPAQAAPVKTGTYVSLGDSLAFGYQPNLVAAKDYNPADYVSYAEDYARMRPHLQLANFGCPGETSTSLISGGCPWLAPQLPDFPNGYPLHMSYNGGSQLQAAAQYIAAHSDISLISVDIGSNDLLAAVSYCETNSPSDLMGCLQAQLPATLHTLASNYLVILGALHKAAPHARLVVFNLYNPLALSLPGSDALITEYVNPTIAQVAAEFGRATGASVSIADAFSVMNHSTGSPAETAFVCTRTWECTTYANIHPTTLGYKQMAIALLHAVQ